MQGSVLFLVVLGCVLGCSGLVEECKLLTQWGGNACSLNGSLRAESIPGKLPVSQEKCDQFYQKSEFAKQPLISFPDAKSGEMYTLVMVDPDAPKHPEGQYYLHWISANIPGDDLKKGVLKNAKTISGYRGPTPPQGTGTHRYQLLVYRHSMPHLRVERELPDSQRRLFDLGAWAAGHRLCGPNSGAQFRTNYEGKE